MGGQMDSMFDKGDKKKEDFHKQVSGTIEANKKKYDRQLYSDWITQVYNTCQNNCIKVDKGTAHTHSTLREIEKVCGRNCIRKYDKIYKLYDALEGTVMSTYCDDADIDTEAFMKNAQESVLDRMEADKAAGLEALMKN